MSESNTNRTKGPAPNASAVVPEILDLNPEQQDTWFGITGALGFFGWNKARFYDELDTAYGTGQWTIAYAWEQRIVPRREALELYTESYVQLLRNDTNLTDWLVSEYADVYDIAPEDTASDTDFALQQHAATHLQDIAIRIALARLGRSFRGNRLLQTRGKSEGRMFNPGTVPFHRPEQILSVRIPRRQWWNAGSVEDFYQRNKLLLLSPDSTGIAERGADGNIMKVVLRDRRVFSCADGSRIFFPVVE